MDAVFVTAHFLIHKANHYYRDESLISISWRWGVLRGCILCSCDLSSKPSSSVDYVCHKSGV